MMVDRIWMKKNGTAGDPLLFRVVEGKLNVRRMAEFWKLDPLTISVGPFVLDVDAEGISVETISDILEATANDSCGDGRSRETPFILDGAPAPAPAPAPASAEDHGTPPKAAFDKWLLNTKFPVNPSMDEVKDFLNSAPVSKRTVWFICKLLIEVPAHDEAHVRVLRGNDAGYFERPDYLEFLEKWGRRGAKVLILSGRRRSGKTLGLPHELIRAREKVLKRTDRVMFYFAGDDEADDIHFSTVIKLLGLMKIPAVFDEFTSMSTKICRSYKFFLENWESGIDPLSAVLFGSNESMIWAQGTSSIAGCSSIGGFMRRLPSPPLALMFSMVLQNNKELKASELGMRFLRKITLHGCDLSSHMSHMSNNEASLKILQELGLQQITFTSGDTLKALERLVYNKGHAKGIDGSTLNELQQQEYIIERPNTTNYYDFLDPRMMAFYGGTLNESLEFVEGKVLELLLQSVKYLLQQLLQFLEINEKVVKVQDNLWHGHITPSTEMDMIFFVQEEAFLVSAKRVQSRQKWGKSFLAQMDNLYMEWKNVPTKLQTNLQTSKKLHLVAVSGGDDGEISGTCPQVYDVVGLEKKIKASTKHKQIAVSAGTNVIPKFVKMDLVHHKIVLHELLGKVECLRYLK